MLFGNAQLYAKARAAKLGRMSLPHPLEQLRHRVSDQFHVTVLYVEFDEIDIGPHEGRTRLNLILETSADYAKLHENPITLRPGVKIAILKSFAEIVAAADLNDHFDTNDVHLIFDDFSDEAMRQATNRFLERDKRRVTRDFTGCNIWKISGFSKSVVVFYLTENDVRTNAVNDTSNRITKRCYELVKQYDEFGYFQFDSFPITFDSKENLDKNFMGNLFYYFR